MTRRSIRPWLAPVLLQLSLCAGSASAEGDPTATADGELPPAILGKAPALSGSNVGYFPADAKTQGYLSEPKGSGPHASVLVHERRRTTPGAAPSRKSIGCPANRQLLSSDVWITGNNRRST